MSRPRRPREAAAKIPELWWRALNDEQFSDADRASVEWLNWQMSQNDLLTAAGDPAPRAIWLEHGESIVEEWIVDRPGTRPSYWWRWSAPRLRAGTLQGRAAGHAGQLWPEPRRRLGGTGTPKFEVLNITPSFSTGVPDSWITQAEAEIYGPDGERPRDPPCPDDPPTFESQVAYLLRHELLLPGELERLDEADFSPVSLFDAVTLC